jgi:phage anti-repressor protein
MENFLIKYSNVPKKFIDDFFNIAKEEYIDNIPSINLDKVCSWLNILKGNLKKILKAKFEENFDFVISKVKNTKRTTGAAIRDLIMITPDCFKELCMISQTPKAKEVRKYFLEIEKLIKRYKQDIEDNINKELGLLKKSNKPIVQINGGIIYIRETEIDGIFKIGKTLNNKKRDATYNTGQVYNSEPIFVLRVTDIDKVEGCIKNIAREFQYAKKKELYQIDFQFLKMIIYSCSSFIESIKKAYMEDHKAFKNNIRKIKRGGSFILEIKKDQLN